MKTIYTKINNIINLTSGLRAVTSNGMINNIYKKNNKMSGFTLVETMVAVLILTLTIVSLMTVVANSLFAARYARDEITSGYLLQEVIDFIRNDRDTSVFLQNAATTDAAWATFTSRYNVCKASTGGCYFDVFGGGISTPTSCSGVTNCRDLYYDAAADITPYYVNDNTTTGGKVRSGYQRKIVVETTGDEMVITVTVFWKNGGLSKSRTLVNTLMKWQS